jgi:hypothetical protein
LPGAIANLVTAEFKGWTEFLASINAFGELYSQGELWQLFAAVECRRLLNIAQFAHNFLPWRC